ncbi:MAG: aminotransferase class V-fold PLP-dependent enzyme, partial [Collinsella sp.]
NTIFGTMFHQLPDCDDVPLVADVSSCFLSQLLDVERYGLIYAGAQKNAGAAGVTVVIVRDDLIADGPAFAQMPQYMDLKTQAAKGSMLNTPNTFGIYVCGKVFRCEQTGGLAAMAERNRARGQPALRPAREQQTIPRHRADRQSLHRQRHVPYRRCRPRRRLCRGRGRAPDSKTSAGHRLVGGMRASVYNAVTMEDAGTGHVHEGLGSAA